MKANPLTDSVKITVRKPEREATFAGPTGSAEYVRVRCVVCAWEDGLRADLAAAGQMGIYCDKCDGAQACELIPPNESSSPMAAESHGGAQPE